MLQLNKGITQSIDYNIIIELINHRYDDYKHNYIFKTLQSFKEGESYSFDQYDYLFFLLILSFEIIDFMN